MFAMQSLIVILLVVLIVVALFVAVRLSKPAPVQTVQTPTTVVAPPVDIAPIIEAVKAGVDKDGIASAVRVAVEAEVRKTAQEALARNNEQAAQQASERLDTHGEKIENQTKLLLQPFEAQVKALTTQVAALQETYANEKGTIEIGRAHV